MMKKKYIKPEIEDILLGYMNTLLEGTTTSDKGEDEVDDGGIGAKGWGGDFFNSDEYED